MVEEEIITHLAANLAAQVAAAQLVMVQEDYQAEQALVVKVMLAVLGPPAPMRMEAAVAVVPELLVVRELLSPEVQVEQEMCQV